MYRVIKGVLLLDVGEFQSDALLLIDGFQDEAEDEGCNTEAGEHDQRSGIVQFRSTGAFGIGGIEHLADKHGEEPQTDVLNPEDERIGRTDDLCIDQLGRREPVRTMLPVPGW